MRKQEFNSKLISLLPLDEVPVHVPLRRPRPLRSEGLRVRVWNPYSRGRLSPAKSEERKSVEGKTDATLTIFSALTQTMAAQHAATPWGRSPPRPLCQKICYSDCTENCPLRPCEHPGRFPFTYRFAARAPCDSNALGRLPTPPPLPENLFLACPENCPMRPLSSAHFAPHLDNTPSAG